MGIECGRRYFSFFGTVTWIFILLHGYVISYDSCPVSDLDVCDVCKCSEKGFIDCSERDLTTMPSNIPRDVLYLNMDRNFITCVPIDFMEQFTQLKILIFSENKLKHPFILPRNLTVFRVNGNNIQSTSVFFFHCDLLHSVHLQHNLITIITDRSFQNCSLLSFLDISLNPIESISSFSFSGLTSMININIGDLYQLKEIQSNALDGVCENLKSLFITGCRNLAAFPVGLFVNCKKVISISINENGITSVDPATFPWLQYLQHLNLATNKFTVISETTFERFENIAVIVLAYMGLLEIPEKLFSNTSVKKLLDLGNNMLREIPEGLFASPSTEHTILTLILSGNKLESIPRRLFWNLPQLKQLHLFQNNLKQLPEGMLSYTSVTSLYLFGNQITNLTKTLFQGNVSSNLTILQVQGNPLDSISTDFLSGMSDQGEVTLSCEKLDIQHSRKDVNLKCVPDTFVTSLTITAEIGKLLRYNGFNCKIEPTFAECTSCRVGHYGDSLLGQCVTCPKGGFYQDEVGQYSNDTNSIQCKQCNNGTFVRDGGGDSPLKCQVCPEGTVKSRPAKFRACFCQENYYRRERFGGCHLCSDVGINCSNDYVTLKSGYYWNWSYTDVNIYKKFILNLQTLNDSYDENTVNFTEPLPIAHECPQSFKCANDNDDIEGNCAIGYSGWMCTACRDGFFPILGYCHRCPTFWVLVVEVVGISFACICFIVYLIYSYRRKQAREDRSIIDIAIARGKILLGFYQIMGEFWDSLDTVYWPEVFKQVSAWLGFLQFNVSSILIKPSCFISQLTLTPYAEFIIGISIPLIVLCIKTVSYLLCHWLIRYSPLVGSFSLTDKGSRLKRMQDKLSTVTLLILFVTYTSTCNVTFALFGPACDSFFLDENKMKDVSLLRSDYSIDCTTPTHQKYEIASYIASVYIIAFPASLLYLLWKNSPGKIQHNDATARSSNENNNPKWFRFLSENYKDRFWFWEIIELVRKMSQTFVVILFGWSSSLSITVSLTLAVIFLCLHSSYSPMKDKFEHYLQLSSLWAIFFNMLVAAVRVPDKLNSVYVQTAMTLILVLLNLSVIFIIIGKIFVSLFKLIYKWCSCSCVISCFPRWCLKFKGVSLSSVENTSPTEQTPLIQ